MSGGSRRGSGDAGSSGTGTTGGPARRSDPARRCDPARYAAFALLRAVDDGAYANLELPAILRRARLSGRDAAFATELAYGTLRWRGFYDAVIAIAAQRPVSAIDAGVLDVLRLGAHQVLSMRVPPHAATDQSVALARAVSGRAATGFVNAVTRRIAEHSAQHWQDTVAQAAGGGIAGVAARSSHPQWIVSALRQALLGHGSSTKEDVDGDLAALLAADNEAAKVTLVARPGLATTAELIAHGGRAGRWAPTAVVLDHGLPSAIAQVRDGRAAVQDEGSQVLTLAFAAASTSVTGDAARRWLDMCAGPGGKSGILAGLALQAGAHLVANDVSEHRAQLVAKTLAAARAAAPGHGACIEIRTGDGRSIGQDEPAAYERVLLDAPCTGLGALRRRPEARWRRTPQDVAALAPVQRDLLRSALDAVAPGGVVGYATCSPHLAETRFVVHDVVRSRTDVDIVDARPAVEAVSGGALSGLGDGPFVQLWPHLHGTDGMFFAVLARR